MMTTAQLKAARALLDWTQQDLAKAAGIHLNVINNLERGTTNPRQNTVERLKKTLEDNGIVFIGTRGVERQRKTIIINKLEGDLFLRALTDDILANVKGPENEVLSTLSDIRNFSDHDANGQQHYHNEKLARGFKERLITRAVPGFYPRNASQYRVLDAAFLGPVDTIIYTDRVAFIFWPEQEIVIMKGEALAQTQRRLFEALWAQGHEPVRTARARED